MSNIVLYLCAGGDDWETGLLAQARGEEEGGAGDAAAAASTSAADAALAARGRAIFEAITSSGPLSAKEGEMAHTALARLAARAGDARGALAAARAALAAGLPPRNRAFFPAMLAHCASGDAAAAFAVDGEAAAAGLAAGERDCELLLGAAARAPPGGASLWASIETVLYRFTREHGRLQAATLDAAARAFASPAAAAALAPGGPLHDASLPPRAWSVARVSVDPGTGAVAGLPGASANASLAPVDLDPEEWDALAAGVATLARSRERRPSDFDDFVAWLSKRGPFGAVVDGANVALFGQNWERGGFDFGQLRDALSALERARPGARPLVILHRSRLAGPAARSPPGRDLLADLKARQCLYAAPHGSNDDWYWLHATVAAKAGGLLVSNDEMRDHAFALLAPALVGRWKERHRATYTFNGRGAELEMPPPFSACAQRVAGGAWLLPPEGDSEAWLAAVPAPVPTEDA